MGLGPPLHDPHSNFKHSGSDLLSWKCLKLPRFYYFLQTTRDLRDLCSTGIYVLIMLSIFSDVTNLESRWVNSNEHALDNRFIQPFSLICSSAAWCSEPWGNLVQYNRWKNNETVLRRSIKAFSNSVLFFSICLQNYRTLELISTACQVHYTVLYLIVPLRYASATYQLWVWSGHDSYFGET